MLDVTDPDATKRSDGAPKKKLHMPSPLLLPTSMPGAQNTHLLDFHARDHVHASQLDGDNDGYARRVLHDCVDAASQAENYSEQGEAYNDDLKPNGHPAARVQYVATS